MAPPERIEHGFWTNDISIHIECVFSIGADWGLCENELVTVNIISQLTVVVFLKTTKKQILKNNPNDYKNLVIPV